MSMAPRSVVSGPRGIVWMSVAIGLLVTHVCSGGLRPAPAPAPAVAVSTDPRAACALSILRSQLRDSGHLVISGNAPWLDGFLEAANVPVTLVQAGQQLPVYNVLQDVFIFVMDGAGNRTLVETAMKTMRRRGVYYARVVFWWRTGSAQEAADVARDLDMARVAVISGSGEDQQVFGFREECRNKTLVPRAVLVGECTAGSLQAFSKIFLDLNHWNFQGCPMSLTVYPEPPHIIVTPRSEGGYDVTGPDSILAHAFARFVNAVINVSDISKQGKVKDACLGMWSMPTTDGSGNRPVPDVSPMYISSYLDLVVPASAGQDAVLVHSVFPPDVWLLVGTAYVMVVLALVLSWRGLRNHPLPDAACFALSTLLGSRYFVPLNLFRDKLWMVSWRKFCFVLGPIYVATFSSLQTEPQMLPEVKTLEQLAASGLFIQGTSENTELLGTYSGILNDPTWSKINAHAWSVSDSEDAMHRVVFKRDVATVTRWESNIHSFVFNLEKKSRRKLVNKIEDGSFNRVPMTLLWVPAGSRLRPALGIVMGRALDAGLVEVVRRLRMDRPDRWPKIKRSWRPLDLGGLKIAFQVLGSGLALAALVALAEYEGHLRPI